MTEVKSAHFIRIRYHGPTDYRGSSLVASWEGWPSEGSRTVRKTIAYTSVREVMAQLVAEAFCEWLSEGYRNDDEPLTFTPDEITLAGMNSTDWALLVHTTASKAGA